MNDGCEGVVGEREAPKIRPKAGWSKDYLGVLPEVPGGGVGV